MTVGFTSTISAVGDSDGIHFFNWAVFQKLADGYSLGQAIVTARVITYLTFGGFYGSESVEWGGGNMILP